MNGRGMKALGIAAALLAGLFLVTWGVGFCRRWEAAQDGGRKPPVTPGRVDPGARVPDSPIRPDAPAREVIVVAPAPDLTPEQVAALARRYGFALVRHGNAPGLPRTGEGPGTPPPDTSEESIASGAPGSGQGVAVWPLFLAEERFCLAPGPDGACPAPDAQGATSTPTVDVACAQPGPGEPVDLRAVWLPYQPPAPKRRLGGIVGEWRKELGVGGLWACVRDADTGENVCNGGVGPGGSLVFDSLELLGGTLTARLSGTLGVDPTSGEPRAGQVSVWIGVRW